MGDSSYRNYAGPSQEYSPGDIDPVSNHVVVDVNEYGNITVRDPGPGGSLTGSAVAQFGRYAASGNLTGYYGYLKSFGSGYGEIGYGYHVDDQSWSGWLSDQYAIFASNGKFSTDSPIYDAVAQDIMRAHYNYMVQDNTIPNTWEIFDFHEEVFARHGLGNSWMGGGLFGGAVDFFMGSEPSDKYNWYGVKESQRCFPAGTLITLADGSKKAIEHITPADRVLTFDDDGRPCAGKVVRTYTNTTLEFIRLVFEDGRGDLVATPGHAFLTETGDYLEIGTMARLGGGGVRLVDHAGEVVTAKAECLVYSAETAHLFATSASRSLNVAGNLALRESVAEGWATFNFEVRTTHNYVAGNIRVHNRSGPVGQLGSTLDSGLDRLSGVRDGDGSFLDKASDLINTGMHVVDRAMKNISAGFSNIGNSIAARVAVDLRNTSLGYLSQLILAFSLFFVNSSSAQTITTEEKIILIDNTREISMICGDMSAKIKCGIRPHFEGEEGYRRCNDNVAEIVHADGAVSKLEFNLKFGRFDDFYINNTPVGLSCIRRGASEYFVAVETSIGFCGGKCSGGDFFNSKGDRVKLDPSDANLIWGNSLYIEEGYDHE